MSPGSPIHLVKRFFESVGARRPGPGDQRFVSRLLDGDAAALFFAQQPMDQAHAVEVARRVARTAPDRDDLVRAALLHDVGKRHSRLGVIGRSVASVLAMLRLPRTRRMEAYLEHGTLGAGDLASAGESEIVVAFAAGHHGPPPVGVEETDWAILSDADGE